MDETGNSAAQVMPQVIAIEPESQSAVGGKPANAAPEDIFG